MKIASTNRLREASERAFARSLVDLQHHVEDQRGRVEVHRAAVAGARAKAVLQSCPAAPGCRVGREPGQKRGLSRRRLGAVEAQRPGAGEGRKDEVHERAEKIKPLLRAPLRGAFGQPDCRRPLETGGGA